MTDVIYARELPTVTVLFRKDTFKKKRSYYFNSKDINSTVFRWIIIDNKMVSY